MKELYNLEKIIREYGITSIQMKEINKIIDELYSDLKNDKEITQSDFENKIETISGWERKMDHTFCEHIFLGYIFSKHDRKSLQLFEQLYMHSEKFKNDKNLIEAINQIKLNI